MMDDEEWKSFIADGYKVVDECRYCGAPFVREAGMLSIPACCPSCGELDGDMSLVAYRELVPLNVLVVGREEEL